MREEDYKGYRGNLNGEMSGVKWLKVGMSVNGNRCIKNYGIVSKF